MGEGKIRNILITGGAGFIGSSLCLALLKSDYNIIVIDNLSKQVHGKQPEKSQLYQRIKNKVKFINSCVTKIDNYISYLKSADAIIHLAAETGTGQSMYEINKYSDVNISGTSKILDYLVNNKHNLKKFIVASSRSIYGEGKYIDANNKFVFPDARLEADLENNFFECKSDLSNSVLKLVATSEDCLIKPSSVYGLTKYFQEQIVKTVCNSVSIPSIALRFQNVYGPGQSLSNPYTGILSIFSNLILNKSRINIFEDGKQSRDFVYINDVVDSIIISLESDLSGHYSFNVGSGEATTVLQIFKLLSSSYSIDCDYYISGNYRLGDIRHNFADLSLIKQKLNFSPKWKINEGIFQFCEWVKDQKISKIDYEGSLNEMKSKNLFKQ